MFSKTSLNSQLNCVVLVKKFINRYIRKYFRFRNYLPRFTFSRVISEILLERIEPHRYLDEWHVKPFNGQVKRTMNICLIANTLKPDYCIETGTYLGTSTIFLAGLARKTWTIEINEAFLQKAKNRFKYSCANLNIEAITGNSVLELPKILKSFSSNEKVLVYLDAHWLHNVPTGNEISILNEWGSLWVAVIDDFKVDHDPGYGYDSYGNLEVSLNIIPNIIGLEVWVPKEKSIYESGARRGTGYIFTSESIKLMSEGVMQNLTRIK